MRSILSNNAADAYSHYSVAGHSIGALVAVHMLCRYSATLQRAFLLTPTLFGMKDSPNGQRNKSFLKEPIIRLLSDLVVPLIGCLPFSIRRKVVRCADPSLHDRGVDIASGMLRGGMARNLLFMAKSEFAQVQRLDVEMLKQVEDRIVGYFVKEDGWVPLHYAEQICSKLPRAAGFVLEEDPSVKHAWCLKDSQKVVAKAIVPFV
jgi:pimeloyl-ACP methyl ester carboxylesterase